MMNKTMMEDKLDGSSIFKFLEDKTSEEGLLWVIQKGETLTTFFMKMSEDRDQPGAIGKKRGAIRYCYAAEIDDSTNCL
jgi:hypothetical protein